jgi:sigma-B regulation protein RsbU (phosphoserine phosphatase)
MKKEFFRIPSLIFYSMTALIIVLSGVSFVKALSWVNRPFAGFLTYPFPYVGSFSSRDWPGKEAGLGYLDRIVSVDGQAVQDGSDVVSILSNKQPGTMVRYLVDSKGTTREVSVPVDTFGIKDFLLVFSVTFLYGLTVYTLGVIVYILKPNTTSSWVFLVMCFGLGVYGVTGFEIHSSYLFPPFNALAIVLFPATFFQLGLIFPERKKILNRLPALEYIIYAPAVVILVIFELYLFNFKEVLFTDSFSWVPGYETISPTIRLFQLFCTACLIGFIIHAAFKASSGPARQRARLMIFGVAMAFLPPAALGLAALTVGLYFPFNFIPLFAIFFPASIAYSIVRHNLFDADVIIRRTVGYVVVTLVVIGAYAGVSISLNVLMEQYQVAQSKAFPILFTLGVILVFNPLRDRIQALVDRIFFRKEYDYGAIVEKVSEAMTSMLELPQILKRLVQTFMEDMFIDTSSVMLLTPDGAQYRVYLADGENKEHVENKTINREKPIIEIIEAEKKELTKYDVIEDPKFQAVSKSSAADFDALNTSLMVPLVYQDKVIGSLNLGEKKSGKAFNREDIDLLRTLAHQGAVAIENARLFQENIEKQRMEEELNIARDLQMSMLPASCPEIKGFQIAASSTPAREVGGDFYDFIEMGEDKAGMVIADVTGKSVSGALVMSSSRSVFRMLSEEHLTVSESMIRANRRLKKDVKTGMFVALLFAVLDSQEKTLTLCSAGQTQPILVSAKTHDATLVETQGDTFPLGILEDASYEETCLQLEPGDKVIFYTDGIVEAMNAQEEMFGFERLQEVAQAAKSMDAESILKEILDKVNEFASEASQHDDITVIAVSVE